MSSLKGTPLVRKVPQAILGVSEPNPSWFGNPANEPKNTNWTNKNWLKSRFHFSFAEYNNPRNLNFGVLRVMNDDLVQPNRGFGAHPHRDVEICTYVVHGELTHKDSMGTEETLGRGAIQFMTAGSGVTHSEHNLHPTNPLRFIQIWINTRQRGLKPNYGSSSMNAFAPTEGSTEQEVCAGRRNKWAHLVSDTKAAEVITPIKINQDANIHVTEVDASSIVDFSVSAGRQAYLLCVEGSAKVSVAATADAANGAVSPLQEEQLTQHDAAELFGPTTLRVEAAAGGAHFLLVEMALTGLGRTDL